MSKTSHGGKSCKYFLLKNQRYNCKIPICYIQWNEPVLVSTCLQQSVIFVSLQWSLKGVLSTSLHFTTIFTKGNNITLLLSEQPKLQSFGCSKCNSSVLARNFITGDNVPGLLKKWGHLRKKLGHCGKNDGTVIWRSKISFPSVYIITDHILTANKQY